MISRISGLTAIVFTLSYFMILTLGSAFSQVLNQESALSESELKQVDNYFDQAIFYVKKVNADSAHYYVDEVRQFYLGLEKVKEPAIIWENYQKKFNTFAEKVLALGQFKIGYKLLDESIGAVTIKLPKSSDNLADAYVALGAFSGRLAHHQKAIEAFKKALSIKIKLSGESDLDIAAIYHNLGMVHYGLKQFEKAIHYSKKSLVIKRKMLPKENVQIANSLTLLGNMLTEYGDYDQAYKYLNDAYLIAENFENGINKYIVNTQIGLGLLFFTKGEYETALDYYQNALTIEKELNTLGGVVIAKIYNNIANVLNRKGDYREAVRYYQRLLDIVIPLVGSKHDYVAVTYNNMASAYLSLGEHDKAIQYYKLSTSIKEEKSAGKGNISLAMNHVNLGETLRIKGDYIEAVRYLDKAEHFFTEEFKNDHIYLATIYRIKGLIYIEEDDFDKAKENFEKSIAIFERILGKQNLEVSQSYRAYGEYFLKKNRFRDALLYFQKAIISLTSTALDTNIYVCPKLENVKSEQHFLWAVASKAIAFHRLFRFETQKEADILASYNHYLRVIDTISQIRRSYQAEDSKLFWSSETRLLYEQAVEAALLAYRKTDDREYLDEAFRFSESAKSAILLDVLKTSEALNFSTVPDSLIEKEKALKKDLVLYKTKIEKIKPGNADSLKLREFSAILFDLTRQYNDFIADLEINYPRYFELKYKTDTASREKISHALNKNTAVLEYFYGDSAIYIFTATNNHFSVIETPKPANFDEKVQRLAIRLTELDSLDFKSFTQNAHTVYNTLLKPVEDKISNKRLLIIPDGILNDLPFEALLTDTVTAETSDFRKLSYLLKKHAISYAYSATLWLETQQQDSIQPRQDYLAFAPVFPNGIKAQTRGGRLLAAHAGLDSTRSRNGYLAASIGEITDINSLFQKKQSWYERLLSKKVKIYWEDEATEQRVKSENLADYKYVHFSTHGLAKKATPDLSWLLFSDDSTSQEDGVLHLGEIYNLELDADLVVLSACETGTGKLARGEGLLGLSRGFIYAGARNLLVSLWKVNGASTANLMVEFYKNMLDGQSKAVALQKAKLNLIKTGATYAKPYHWAPFVLIGQ